MHIESNRVTRARRRARSARSLRVLGLVLSLAFPSAAQGPRVVVSTTDDVPPAAGLAFPATDADLMVIGSGQPVEPHFMGGHFQGSTGFLPTDIDAFTRLPGPQPGRAESLVFSLLSNEAGFLDGDILGLASNGGAVMLLSELDVATALGASGANIDVDALSYDDQGRILFSLTTD